MVKSDRPRSPPCIGDREGLLQGLRASSSRRKTSTPPPTCWRCWRRTSCSWSKAAYSAGYFNALEKNLPITMVMDRVSEPRSAINLMLRPDLKGQVIAAPATSKARSSPATAQGSVSTYEVGKMLETDGADASRDAADVKVLPFNQMAIALHQQGDRRGDRHSAVHLAVPRSGLRGEPSSEPDDLVKPWPLTIAVAHDQHRLGGSPTATSCATTSPPICAACATITKPITGAQNRRRA